MLKAYLGYLLGPGQQLLPSLSYAPLPANIDSDGQGAAQQDHLLSTMAHTDQIGSPP